MLANACFDMSLLYSVEVLTDTRTLNKRYVPILRKEIQPR